MVTNVKVHEPLRIDVTGHPPNGEKAEEPGADADQVVMEPPESGQSPRGVLLNSGSNWEPQGGTTPNTREKALE